MSVTGTVGDATTVQDPIARVAAAHVDHRTIVIPELQVLYVPVPKTGWTGVLWALATLAGLSVETFRHSTKPEISTSMAVHDYEIWGEHGRRLLDLDADARHDALHAEGWLRFGVVRDPSRRLWSAWQSKLLLREPVYFGFHHDKPWYPRLPQRPDEVVEDFRTFVRALDAGFDTDPKLRDPHWGRQSDVVDLVDLTHIGRMEALGDTEDLLRAHVAARGGPEVSFARENAMPLPYSPVVYDDVSADVVRRRYARDYATFGYPPVMALADDGGTAGMAQWADVVSPRLPQLRELADRHQRLYAVVEAHRTQLHSERAESRRLATQLDQAREKTRLAREQVRRLEAEVAAMTRSTSWRLTAPVRRIGRVVKRRG